MANRASGQPSFARTAFSPAGSRAAVNFNSRRPVWLALTDRPREALRMDLCVILRVRLDHFDPSRRWRLGMQERKTMLPADAGHSLSVAGRCSAAGAEFLRRLRDQKLYLSRAVACEEFRPQYLLLGKTPASSITRNLEEFSSRPPGLTCISHRTLRVALWRRLFSLPRRLSSRRMDREPLQQHVSARVPRRQPKRLRHEQLAQCRLKGE